MSESIEEFDWTITEARQVQLDLERRRLMVEQSVSMHRDKQSIRDLRQMLDLLTEAGAPDEATVHVQNTNEAFVGNGHLRIYAQWKKEQRDDG